MDNENESAESTQYSFTVDDGSVQLPEVNIETANSSVDITEDLKANQALQSKEERSISTGDNSNVGNDGSGKEKIGGEEGQEKQKPNSGSNSSEESDE